MRRALFAVIALAGWLAAATDARAQSSTINFDVAGPADWNTATNWIIPNVVDVFVPGDGFPDEVAGISNAGTATLSTPALFPVFGVVIGETHDPSIPNPMEEDGTLNISGTGQLQLVDPGAAGNAALRIGDAGRGVLNFSGGSVLADRISVGGAADSALNLSGNAILAISGNATLDRITRIEGPSATFDIEGDLTIGGTFIPVITGATHSTITAATGRARLGGVLRPEFGGGFAPSVGDSWTLVHADTVTGSFASIDTSQAPSIPRGATFGVAVNQTASFDVVLSLGNRLILNVDRTSGAATIENAIGDAIEINGYTISSPSGALDQGNWQSLDDAGGGTWEEANPSANFLAELNPTGATSFSVAGGAVSIGSPFGFRPAKLGESGDDLGFEYLTSSGEILPGIVEYTGPENNLVLTVNTDTGEGVLTNDSTFDINMFGYSVRSASGSLSAGTWNSLQDQGEAGWEEANPSANALNELNPMDSLALSGGSSVNLGNLFNTAGSKDLALEFFFETAGGGGPLGDTNGDNVVNIDDLNNVRNNFGGMEGGDTDGDGDVDIDDLNNVRNNFGAMGNGGGGGEQDILVGLVKYVAGGAAVPEPATWVLLALGFVSLAVRRRKPHSA